ALKRTFISTGKAIIVTSIILCGGFLTLIMSDFLGTFYIGLLISLTLLFAVLADLLLLPVLLIIFFKPDSLKSVQKTVAPRTDGVLSPQA
ncbi:MAG: MMPL family transporter, partial [Flavobacteriales bacterium]|nr:MMPL family transporter [Flavobacteriales bacterium]